MNFRKSEQNTWPFLIEYLDGLFNKWIETRMTRSQWPRLTTTTKLPAVANKPTDEKSWRPRETAGGRNETSWKLETFEANKAGTSIACSAHYYDEKREQMMFRRHSKVQKDDSMVVVEPTQVVKLERMARKIGRSRRNDLVLLKGGERSSFSSPMNRLRTTSTTS